MAGNAGSINAGRGFRLETPDVNSEKSDMGRNGSTREPGQKRLTVKPVMMYNLVCWQDKS